MSADPTRIVLGRDAESCDVVVDERSVSRTHATIHFDAAQRQYLLSHLGGSSPLQIEGGPPVEPGQPQPIRYGIRVRIGLRAVIEISEPILAKLVAPATFRRPYVASFALPEPSRAAPVVAETAPAPRPSGASAPAGARPPTPPGTPLRVGRDAACELRINAPQVSRFHAEVWIVDGEPGVLHVQPGRNPEDGREPTNGIRVNGGSDRIVAARVRAGDVLHLGSYRLAVARLHEMVQEVARPGVATEKLQVPSSGRFVLGRDPDDAQVVLQSPQVSRRHAEVEVVGPTSLRIRDLGSANGTFVNGRRIKDWTAIGTDDRITLGSYHLELTPGQPLRRQVFRGNIRLEAQQVAVEVPDRDSGAMKRLVDNVSLTVFPSELVGLMGPSGAGKTTLLKSLNGYTSPSNGGRVLINGEDLYERYPEWQHDIGYLPQDDIVFPQLTVRESLYFTARLRLPPDTSTAEIEARINDLLKQVDLTGAKDVRIGDAVNKGISGGQRKRVNLAQELITEPSLLFLDEPTSGLASGDTQQVLQLLRDLADRGKTILLTIHQPSLAVYRLMDNVVYLFEGRMIYYGPTHPDSILFLNSDARAEGPAGALAADPGAALTEIEALRRRTLEAKQPLGPVVAPWVDRFQSSDYYRDYVHERSQGRGGAVETTAQKRRPKTSRLHQLRVLVERLILVQTRDRLNTGILLAQAPVISGIMLLVFGPTLISDPTLFDRNGSTPGALFMLVAAAIWFGCSNAARAIIGEQAVYIRERMVNLRIDSYLLSKFVVLGGLCAVQCLLLLGLTYPVLGFEGGFLTMYGILLLTALVGTGMGLAVSALVRSVEAAVALVPILLIPQILLGGVLAPASSFSTPVRWLSALTASRWAYEAMLTAETGDQTAWDWFDACAGSSNTFELSCERILDPLGETMYATTRYHSPPPTAPSGMAPTVPRRASVWAGCGEEARAERHNVLRTVPFEMHAILMPPLRSHLELPSEEPMCMTLCTALQGRTPITPLERAFGVHEDTWWRTCVEEDVGDLPEAQRGQRPDPHWRMAADRGTALKRLFAILSGILLALALFIGGVLMWKDPIPDADG